MPDIVIDPDALDLRRRWRLDIEGKPSALTAKIAVCVASTI